MPVDGKYGKVTLEHGDHIPAGEPVIVFRAADRLSTAVLTYYYLLCQEARCKSRHLDLILAARNEFRAWQEDHPPKTPGT